MGVLKKEDVIKLINNWWVVYFRNKKYNKTASPHYYVSIPITDDDCLLLCVITSQICNKESYYQKANLKASNSLVYADSKDINILTRQSVIDCNNPIYDSRNNILQQQVDIESFKIKHEAKISLQIKKKIIMAIKNSPMVKPIIKNIIKEEWK